MSLRSYRDLIVWQRAMELADEVYRLTSRLPAEERFALGLQLRKACCSVPANIAEGYGREFRAENLRHLSIAQGSLAELETLLMLAARAGHLGTEELLPSAQLSDEVGRMLTVLLRNLGSRRPTRPSRPSGPSRPSAG